MRSQAEICAELMLKQDQGYKLTEAEIMELMLYALELLRQFGKLTEESINRLDRKLDELDVE